MPKEHPAPSSRGTGPNATQTYIAGTGANACVSHGPLDGANLVCLTVALLPSASWKAMLPFIGRMNTYYAASKDVSVLTAAGASLPADSDVSASMSLFGLTLTAMWYHVLPADVTSELAALTALITSGNIAKGGNP